MPAFCLDDKFRKRDAIGKQKAHMSIRNHDVDDYIATTRKWFSNGKFATEYIITRFSFQISVYAGKNFW